MNIDELQAGEETDALVAEKIMNWRVHFRNTAFWVKSEDEGEATTDIKGFTCGNDRFSPSADISAAWKVVEKMQSLGYAWLIGDSPIEGNIVCGFSKRGVGLGTHAETAPLAICRAALKALAA